MSDNQLPPGTLQMGSGEPILLFHGIMGTPIMWRAVLSRLSSRYRAIAPAALGHAGGRARLERPTRIQDVVDDAERTLDVLGIERAYLAGNSLGGWVALELSRRGRALGVCAFSPAGMWGDADSMKSRADLKAILALTRRMRFVLPLLAGFGGLRRVALQDSAVHGERVTSADLIAMADATLACTVAEDLLAVTERFVELQVTCPTDVVWSAHDRIFPLRPFAETARQRVIGARHLVLDDVGHVPMFDNPELVTQAILNTIERVRTQPVAADTT